MKNDIKQFWIISFGFATSVFCEMWFQRVHLDGLGIIAFMYIAICWWYDNK